MRFTLRDRLTNLHTFMNPYHEQSNRCDVKNFLICFRY